jgi:Tat protein secretion system quality control protein TatD with DNase activity
MKYIDIHAHLDFESFDKDRELLAKKFEEENIIVFSNTLNQENYLKTKELFQGFQNVFVTPGLYPQDAEKLSEKEFEEYLKC